MKRFLMTLGGVSLLTVAMTFVMTVGATVQETFWNEIATGNMAEIAAGNLALQKAQSEQVKQFAQQMVTDHTAAGAELQTLAASKNVTLPSAITAKQQAEMDKLGARSGADFDREFMKMMVRDHDKMAKLLSREGDRNSDAEVKQFVAKTYPVVQSHLTTARTLSDGLRGAGNSRRSEANDAANTNSNRRSDKNDKSSAGNSSNGNSSKTGYSNLRPNVNPNSNSTMNTNSRENSNSNRSNRNSNSNRSNGNTNSNSNNNSNNNSNRL